MAVFIGMVNSIASYMLLKQTPVEWGLIGAELIGIVIGSVIGPKTSKFIPDRVLKYIFIVARRLRWCSLHHQGLPRLFPGSPF